ncbi:MAG: AMP-binding protein [Clostridia bacterium]|nr:AMP-binding protein [Clostridia bacterium]
MDNQIKLIAQRIIESRRILGKSAAEMAEIIGITPEQYEEYERGDADYSFTFLYKCAKIFGIDVYDLLTGESTKLSTYQVVRNGAGFPLARRKGFSYNHLAVNFKEKQTEPFLVTAPFKEEALSEPIKLSSHRGVEFDYVLSGTLKVRIGDHVEILREGDSVYYNSETPHGMIAIDGKPCEFLAILTDDKGDALFYEQPAVTEVPSGDTAEKEPSQGGRIIYPAYIYEDFIDLDEDSEGNLKNISFKNTERFNFGFDVVDRIAAMEPGRLAMLHISGKGEERRFTFDDIRRYTNKTANYLKSIGVKKGDRVLLVLKRHYQFWFSIIALHKLGAIAIPATNQLVEHDFVYRFNAAGVKMVIATADGDVANQIDKAAPQCPELAEKVLVGGKRDGWRSFDDDIELFSSHYSYGEESEKPCGWEPAIMFFTSGTTGYPKIAVHAHTYALGHFITARYWHKVRPDGIHLTISDTGWGKALWGKLYGQWLCGGAVFVYDFDRFKSEEILPMFKKYNITTFCAPPTMYRFFIKDDLYKYDLSSIKHATVAGEALNPEVFNVFLKLTGLKIMEAFGQTETTLTVGNLSGMNPKVGSMGKPSPMYDVEIVDPDGKPSKTGDVGEIVIKAPGRNSQVGLFLGYFRDQENTDKVWHDGYYHTGDTAWKDEDGYFWYVGRTDDLIKSSGYRIGPFEIESVIMELPYVLECAVTGVPDPIRGQVVKATVVLTKGTEPTEDLKKEIQNYVKKQTAPYKYPRIVDFVNELPKTISGKIKRNELR